jgi:hypothetical protein
VIVVDEYLAVDILRGHWPEGLPDDELGLPATHHYACCSASTSQVPVG